MSDSRFSHFCDALIEAGWLLAIIVTPIFFNMYSRRGFEADKLAVLRALIAVMAVAWLIGWLDRRTARSSAEKSLRRSLLTWATALFAIITLISTLTSIAPRVAWLGSYTRQQGALTLLSLVALSLMVADRLRTRTQWTRLLNTLVLASVPVAIYALLQAADLDPLWGQRGAGGRATATQGNPIYLAAYMMMMFFVTLGLAVEALRHRRQASSLGRGFLYGLVTVVQAAAVFAGNSRGPFVGWLIGLGMLALLAAVLARRRTLIVGALGLAACAVVLLIAINLPNSPLAGLRDALGLNRLLALTANPGDSADVRTLIWQGSSALAQPHAPVVAADNMTDALNVLRPFIGYGPDSLYLVFQQFFPPELTTRGGYPADTLVGRSHNETWDALAIGGLLGLLAYQAVFLAAWLTGLTVLRLVNTQRQRRVAIALWLGGGALGGVAALAVNALTYAGLLIPAGTLAGLTIYLVGFAIRAPQSATASDAPRVEMWLVATLLAAITAHYVEIQFGIAVAATRLLFWLFAALITVAGSERPALQATPHAASWLGRVAAEALITVGLLLTLISIFVVNYEHLSNLWEVIWHSLTFDIVHNLTSGAVALMIVLTWLMALVMMLMDLPRAQRLKGGAVFAAFSIGLVTAFALVHAGRPGVDMITTTGDIASEITIADQRVQVFDLYVAGLSLCLVLIALATLTDQLEQADRARWVNRWWSAAAGVPVVIGLIFWNNAVNFDPIRADMIYRHGQGFEQQGQREFAMALYQYALKVAPDEDVYWRGLAATQLANGEFEAARDSYARAQQLSPLNADYAAGLAQTYQQWATGADPQTRQARLALAETLYAQAARLRPADAQLQAALAQAKVLGAQTTP